MPPLPLGPLLLQGLPASGNEVCPFCYSSVLSAHGRLARCYVCCWILDPPRFLAHWLLFLSPLRRRYHKPICRPIGGDQNTMPGPAKPGPDSFHYCPVFVLALPCSFLLVTRLMLFGRLFSFSLAGDPSSPSGKSGGAKRASETLSKLMRTLKSVI